MGYFDFLIDKDNGKPKDNIEYIYLFDMIWTPNKLEDEFIKVGTIMTNVIQLENGSYEFKCKMTGKTYRTNYAWALAENTPENIIKIEEYQKEYNKFKEHEKIIYSLWNNIVTLKQ